MMKSMYSFALKILLGVFIVVIASSVVTNAQQYTVVPGYTGPGSYLVGSNYYAYNYPNYYRSTQYTYMMFYDYFAPVYTEWIVTAQDMRNAGLCAGPIDAMSLQFIRNPITWNARIRLFVKAIPSTQSTLGYNFANGGYPDYYFTAVKGMGSNIQAATGGVEVHDDPNFSMAPIPPNDTTWVNFNFNKNTFTWDGTSSIVIGLERCQTTYAYQYAEYMVTSVRPPNPYTYYNGNFGSYPMNTGYYYAFYSRTCEQGPAYYILPNFLYEYNYQTYQYNNSALRPYLRLRNLSGISQSFPDDVDPRYILRATEVYNGSDATHPLPSLTYYSQIGKSYTITYKITGPNPSLATVYEARQSGNTSITFTGTVNGWTTYSFGEAVGTYAGTAGALDLTNATGGSYRVIASFASDCGTQTWAKQFIIAFPWDVAMAEIRSPKPLPKKNPLNVTLPLSAQIQNVGLNNITDVDVNVVVRKYPSGVQVFDHQVKWTGNMATGQRGVVDLIGKAFIPTAVGTYSAEFCAKLNDNIDQQVANDCLPTSGTYIFQVNYNAEASAGSIIKPSPSGSYYANRPLQPQGDIFNNGILDLSDVPVLMEIFNAAGQKVYSEQVLVQSVDAAAPNNYAGVVFPLFTPDAPGQYTACMTVKYPGDPDKTNDQVCQTFTVNPNLSGTYTIGTLKNGQPRNYSNIELAMSDLFLKGVSGPVAFEFTDASYTINGSISTNNVALDLSGYVPGMSATNTVTFKPALNQSLSRGSVTITLNSLNGIGVLFGQQLQPSNYNSLGREFPYVRSYSNSAGYYIFDGGLQKSIRVQLGATTAFRAPFYLGNGSQNITL
ncbi:MAG: hypothetical protein HYX66_05325, partial [Ignavibacteria bacterium]|nr:hypothetical protein [Ignavibacteria bacterium]